MVVVEAVDELLAVDVALVLRPRVPQGDVGVDDEVAVAVLAVHAVSSCSACDGCHNLRPSLGASATAAEGPASQSETPVAAAWPPRVATLCNVDHRRPDVDAGVPDRIEPAPGSAARRRRERRLRRAVPRRLLASWQRSEDYGIPLEAVDPVFTGTDDRSSLFFQCGNEVLADLHRTLADEPVSMMLTDADGVVLQPAVGRPHAAGRPRRGSSRTGVRLRRARRRHQRAGVWRSPTGRPPWSAPTSTTHRTEHLHLCRGSGARPGHRPAGGQRQPDDVVGLVERSAAGAGAVGGQQHHRPDAGAGGRPDAARPTPRGQVFRVEVPQLEPGVGNAAFTVGGVELRGGTRPGVPWRRARSCWPSGSRAPGARRCSARPPGRRIRATASCRPAPRPRRRADLAGAVDTGTRQGPHRGHRA